MTSIAPGSSGAGDVPGGAVAPPVVAPPPGHPRFPLIDSLRAIAAISVVIVHAGGLTGATLDGFVTRAEVGVTIFFAISGFLLYRPFVSARLNGAPRTHVRDYLRRRILRIVPAYWLALTALAIWPGLTGVFTGHFWVYYGFGQVYNDAWALSGIGPAWTLDIEITFYLALPLYAMLVSGMLGRLSRSWQMRAELVVLAAISAGSLAYLYVLRSHESISPVLNTLPTHLDWFAPGMALAVLSAYWQDRALPNPLRLLARYPEISIAIGLIAYAVESTTVGGPFAIHLGTHLVVLYSGGEDIARHLLYATLAVGLLLPAVFGEGGWYRRLLGWRTLAWLGLISYGIYLWHQSIVVWFCQPGPDAGCNFHGLPGLHRAPFISLTVVALLLAIVCAAGSYYLVERPILRFKDRRRR